MVTLQDPSKIKVYTWYSTGSQGNYINEYGTEGRSSYSTDRAKSASFRVERKDGWEISENTDITSNKSSKSKFYMISLSFSFGFSFNTKLSNVFYEPGKYKIPSLKLKLKNQLVYKIKCNIGKNVIVCTQ